MIDRIEFLFRTSLYLLLTLSSVSIGLAEGNLFPHLLTIPLIALAYFYLDENPILRIDSVLTGILGLAALGISFLEFRQGAINVEMRILAASHLLAYFTWTVLLIKKKNQQYWWLLALSLLNMSICAGLTNSFALGVSLLSYLFLAVWTLTLFTTYRGTIGLKDSTKKSSAIPVISPGLASVAKTTSPRHLPVPLTGIASRVRGGFHIDPAERWIGARLLGVVTFISTASLFVGMGLFQLTPRVWIGNFQFPASTEGADPLQFGKSVSGFTEEVKLGDIGELLQSSSPVMRVKLVDYQTDRIMSPAEVSTRLHHAGLKFRGTSLSIYQRGSWSEAKIPLGSRVPSRNIFGNRNFSSKAIRINYDLEPVGRATLFANLPVDAGVLLNQSSGEILRNSISGELTIPTEGRSVLDTVKYETICEPAKSRHPSGYPVIIHQDRHVHVSEAGNRRRTDKQGFQKVLDTISSSLETEYQKELADDSERRTDLSRFTLRDSGSYTRVATYDLYLRLLLKVDHQELARHIATSKQLCDQAEAITPVERVQVLQNHLKDSSKFSYTLNLSVTDPTIDPVEDFLFNRKSGHCEYFASALTLMLRSVGIPARLVTGFAEGRWDKYSNTLLIEQRHAHAWVEAFVDGRWLVLDPTPASGIANQNDLTMSSFSWKAVQAKLSSFWQHYVLGVSLAGQNENIYEPMGRQSKSIYLRVNDLVDSYRGDQTSDSKVSAGKVHPLIWGLVVILIIGMLVVVYVLIGFRVQLPRLIRQWLPGRSSQSQQKQMLLFFRRFLDLAARNGLKKRPEQTAREFAHLFEDHFHQQLAAVSLNSLPESLTNAYYQVRFRGNKLSEQDLDQWKVQIDQLAQAMKVRYQ